MVIFSCDDKNLNRGNSHWDIVSPNGMISSSIQMQKSGQITYRVFSDKDGTETEIIETSPMGIIREDQAFDSLQFIAAGAIKTFDQTYTLSTGKQLKNRNHYKELTLNFKNSSGAKLDLIIRAYNDGIAFKYIFPENDKNLYTVIKELSGFNLPEKGQAWIQPYDIATAYAPAYERNYEEEMPIGTAAPSKEGWAFPALFETEKHWVLLTEANLKDNFYGSHLNPKTTGGLYTITPPNEEEAFGYGDSKARSTLPWEMPWRVIIIGDEVGDIVESNLVSHVSDASVIADPSWILPGRASWGWWSGYLDKSNDTPEKLKRFIDFAQIMGWEYSMVDAGWDNREGLDIKELAAYAKNKGVKLLLWYNSGGPTNRVDAGPRDFMFYPEMRKKEMKRISDLGIKGIKIDFFGSDKQDFMKLYHDILKDATEYKLLVNFHGGTIPRGWSRTFPNLISLESVKGSEGYIYHPDFEEKAPVHNTVLPFTRNVIGPMDYTPAAFSVQTVPHRTTYGHELALTVVFESGIQHFPDTPEVYLGFSEEVQGFLRSVPAAWDKTKFIDGYPGDEVVIAREKDQVWFVGGINGEELSKEIEVDFSFLEKGEYQVQLISDGDDNTSFSSSKIQITESSKEVVKILPFGGFVMKINKRI